jgi:hypothetical protein
MEYDQDDLCRENPFMMGCGLTREPGPERSDDSFTGTVGKLWGHVRDFFTGGSHDEKGHPRTPEATDQFRGQY